MTYQECVDYILSIPLFASKLGTDNLNKILDKMEHPERDYPVIHVAGTNGKGSTCSFLASILEASGKRVGLFTSPHLVKINERIRINNQIIPDEAFVRIFCETMEYVELAKKEGIAHPSFFEFVFLMAALYFREEKADYVIFATGMGGRLDATNVVNPVLSIITSVGLDHTQFLGDTIEKIAQEKAGIIKPGIPVVFFDRKDAATPVMVQHSQKMGAKLYLVEKSQYNLLKITDKVIDFSFKSDYYKYVDLKIRKTALYQIENAILAVKAYEILTNTIDWDCNEGSETDNGCRFMKNKPDFDIDCIRTGLQSMVWKGRMECIFEHIYIDGAHNEEAIEAFCQTLEVLFKEEQKILLFAVSRDKDYENMIKRLCEISFDEIIIVRYEGSRAAELDAVEATFRRFSGSRITSFEDINEGFLYGKSHVGNRYLFCVGSLYLAGNLLSLGV